jgi:predicted nucleotidyltransferase
MITRDEIRNRRDEINRLASRHGAHDVRIFGSVARGDATDASDLDLVVRFEAGRTLMDHAGLLADLEELLGTKVDVIDADGMQSRFREVVEREALPL